MKWVNETFVYKNDSSFNYILGKKYSGGYQLRQYFPK